MEWRGVVSLHSSFHPAADQTAWLPVWRSRPHLPECISKLHDSLQCHYHHRALTPQPPRSCTGILTQQSPVHNGQVLHCDFQESGVKSFPGTGLLCFWLQEMCLSPHDVQIRYIFIVYILLISEAQWETGLIPIRVQGGRLFLKGAAVTMWVGRGEQQGQ